MSGLAAAVVEAWQELRIHKLRVLLSLVGVGVAVCSLTSAVAIGGIAKQALVEQSERENGRPATFGIHVANDSGLPRSSNLDTRRRQVISETMEDFGITYYSRVGDARPTAVLAGKPQPIHLRVVDPPYADMHRIVVAQGRWLSAQDARNYSPAIVVDSLFLKKHGLGSHSLPATVTLYADTAVTATIVGQVPPNNSYAETPTAYMLTGTYERWFRASQPLFNSSYQMWVPAEGSKALGHAVEKRLRARLGNSVSMGRQDYLAYGGGDQFKEFRYVLGGISALILLLGALSLLNIALVTIKQRVREIGIRRSFGATTGRVFFSVMMESVVATFVAGLIGVVAAVGIVGSPLVAKYVVGGVTDMPPFPVSAAVLGLVVSLLVGVLAGVLPAMIAVRVRIIDAIRF